MQGQGDINLVDKYARFCKLVLSEVILFNRRRSGEAQHLQKKAFSDSLVNSNVDEEVKKTLSKFEQQLCETHTRIETRGKRGRKVAVLLTQSMKEDIEYLILLQKQMNMHSEYIFVQPNSSKPYRGSSVLKQISEEANLKHPERITSTNLRKQLATMSQLLGLTSNHNDILARFMGHDIRIHRDFYRLPQNTIQVAKVSKVLHLVNSGKISELQGKNLDNLDILEPVDDETDDETDEIPTRKERGTEVDDEDSESNESFKARSTRKKGLSSSYQQADMDEDYDDDDDDRDEDWRPPRAKKGCLYDYDEDDDSMEEDIPVPIGKNKGKRLPWTTEEKRITEGAFGSYLALKRLPGKRECEELIQKNNVLKNRKWMMVKDYIRNKIVSMDRKLHTKNTQK